MLTTRRVDDGDTLHKAGDACETAYIVVAGRVCETARPAGARAAIQAGGGGGTGGKAGGAADASGGGGTGKGGRGGQARRRRRCVEAGGTLCEEALLAESAFCRRGLLYPLLLIFPFPFSKPISLSNAQPDPETLLDAPCNSFGCAMQLFWMRHALRYQPRASASIKSPIIRPWAQVRGAEDPRLIRSDKIRYNRYSLT